MSSPAVDRNISKFDDNKRGLAKLMARENITVQIIDGQRTAMFDVVSRVLTLPNWPFINVDQLDTLIAHEIGHALFTDHSYLERYAQRRQELKNIFTYINVVEDSRIERRIREAYPGMKLVFYNGYKEFTVNGPILQIADARHLWFNVKGQKKKVAVKTLSLIDRLNLFYKIGALIDVPFAPDEVQWIDRVNSCYSTENACEIAEELYKLAQEVRRKRDEEKAAQDAAKPKKEKKEKKSKPNSDKADDGESGEAGEESEDGEAGGGAPDAPDEDEDDAGAGGGAPDAPDSEEGDDDADASHSAGGEGDEGDDEGQDDDDDDMPSAKSAADADADGEAADGEAGEGEDGDDDADAAKSKGGDEGGVGDELPDVEESLTDQQINDGLSQSVDRAPKSDASKQIRHLLLKPIPDHIVTRRTCPVATFVAKNAPYVTQYETRLKIAESDWNAQYLATAKHMASEFMRKKTAKELQRATVARSGRLDLNRLHSYRTADDLFRRVTSVPTGQSHGIVMTIDGSGSMNSELANVISQVILFANFAFQCKIPFEAYMFTDAYNFGWGEDNLGVNTITLPMRCSLIQLVNTTTDRRSFKAQMRTVHLLRLKYIGGGKDADLTTMAYGSTNGTPLFGAMLLHERHVARMKRTLNLDKMISVILSDGGDGGGLLFSEPTVAADGKVTETMTALHERALVVRDTFTKKNHILVKPDGKNYTTPTNGIMSLLFDVMHDRSDASTIYIYINGDADTLRRDTDAATVDVVRDEVTIVQPGVAKLSIVLSSSKLEMTADTAFTVKPGQNIATAFIAHQRKAQANRVFINTLIPFLT